MRSRWPRRPASTRPASWSAPASEPGLSGRAARLAGGRGRQPRDERGGPLRRILHRDAPAVGLHREPGEVEPQPVAHPGAALLRSLNVLVEDPGAQLLLDRGAVAAHGEVGRTVL